MKNYIHVVLFLFTINVSAQNMGNLPVITPPQAPNPYNRNIISRQPVNPYNPNENSNMNRRNEALMNEAAVFQQEIEWNRAIQMLIDSGFPMQSYQDPEGAECFYRAFDEISAMLKGDKPLNLGRVVFLVENAFYGNTLDYSEYQNFIKRKIELCHRKIKEDKLDRNNNLVKNMMLFRLVADTLEFKSSGTEKSLTHLPIRYDYKDYDSQKSYDSHFITKLMKSGVGQCYSMPLYYLVLAEGIGADAYWSFSPKHTFVKIQDEKGRWYNLELTCGAILSDAHYMNNSYIKAEAIRNRLYLEPLDKTNSIAEMLLELASGYYQKYGLDDFYLKCADTAGQYLSNNLNVLMQKAAYEQRLTLTLAQLLDAKNPEVLKAKSPEAYRHYELMQSLYKQIDGLGYEDLPNDLYTKWLDHLAKEKSNHHKTLLIDEIH